MKCYTNCGNNAEVNLTVANKIVYPMCAECYLTWMKYDKEIKEKMKEVR